MMTDVREKVEPRAGTRRLRWKTSGRNPTVGLESEDKVRKIWWSLSRKNKKR